MLLHLPKRPPICESRNINGQETRFQIELETAQNGRRGERAGRESDLYRNSKGHFRFENFGFFLSSEQNLTDIERVDGIAAAFESETDSGDQLEGLCEVLELTGKVQHSIFSTISNISESTGSNILQTRLLPWLGSGFIGRF